jgi:hypothetical protein
LFFEFGIKSDFRLSRNLLKGQVGDDMTNTVFTTDLLNELITNGNLVLE